MRKRGKHEPIGKQIERWKGELDDLFEKIKKLPPNDAKLQSHWARYLCVLVSGFIEQAVYAIYAAYAHETASPNVANYVEGQLEFFQNPNMQKILDLTRSFNSQWADDLEKKTKGKLKVAIDSVVNTRNLIAHGEDTGITYVTISQYYESVKEVIEIIREQCDS